MSAREAHTSLARAAGVDEAPRSSRVGRRAVGEPTGPGMLVTVITSHPVGRAGGAQTSKTTAGTQRSCCLNGSPSPKASSWSPPSPRLYDSPAMGAERPGVTPSVGEARQADSVASNGSSRG